MNFKEFFEEISTAQLASPTSVELAFDEILRGNWTVAQVAGFCVALRLLGENENTLISAVQSMRRAMCAVDLGSMKTLDTCGTGGDGKGTLNISTASAIVIASCGVPVAKHGNRSVSSRSGSADVLEALGISMEISKEQHRNILERSGITFLFAPAHHPALKHAAIARKELGIRTIFNALGPLCNPAGATHQLVGVYDNRLRNLFAKALQGLGAHAAWVVRSEEGLDEISPWGRTWVTELISGQILEREVSYENFGIEKSPPNALDGGDAIYNAKAIESILQDEDHPGRNAVIINAAAGLAVFHEQTDTQNLKQYALRARHAIQSGKAFETLRLWQSIANTQNA